MTHTAAARQRRARARRRDGRCVFRIEADRDRVIEVLLETGRLSEAEGLRRDAVEQKLADVLRDWWTRWLADRQSSQTVED